MRSEFGKSHIVRTEISARSLDVYRAWRRNEVLWYKGLQTWWKKRKIPSINNGTELPGEEAPSHTQVSVPRIVEFYVRLKERVPYTW